MGLVKVALYLSCCCYSFCFEVCCVPPSRHQVVCLFCFKFDVGPSTSIPGSLNDRSICVDLCPFLLWVVGSRVMDLLSGSYWAAFLSITGMHTEVVGNFCLSQQGTAAWVSMGCLMWSSSSGYYLPRILLWWIKLDLLSLPFVGLLILLCMGWTVSLLNFAAWVSTLVLLLFSRDCRPVVLSSVEIGVWRMAPVITRMAWFWILLVFSVLDFAAVQLEVMPGHTDLNFFNRIIQIFALPWFWRSHFS